MAMQGINNGYINNLVMQNAQSATQANMASLKGEKELKKVGVQDDPDDPNDAVELSSVTAEPTTDQQMASAENSGGLSQMDPQLKNRDHEKVESGRAHAQHLAEEEQGGGKLSEMAEGGVEADALHTQVDGGDRGPQRTEQEIIEQLMSGMPKDIQEVSGQMVIGQISGTRPAESLTKLHNLPEPGIKELGAAPMLSDIMEIHDMGNLPMALHLEEAV